MRTFLPRLLFVAIAVGMPFFSQAYTFFRDLTLGDTGEDVYALQLLLNSDPRTLVAASGAGSPGHETSYFGARTKAAVMRYQELHAQKILTPLGFSAGTGYVGPSTRAVLSLEGAWSAPTVTEPVVETETIVPNVNEADFEADPVVTSLSRAQADAGTVITINGRGFTRTDNEIHTNRGIFDDIDSADGRTLVFTFPAPGTAMSGVVDSVLFVENENGKSEPVFFIIGM